MKYLALNEEGRMISVDIHTGEEKLLEAGSHDTSLVTSIRDSHDLVETENGLVWVPKSISFEDLKKVQGRKAAMAYSYMLAEKICFEIASGKTLVEVSRMPGMPSYSAIARWRRLHPEFQQMYELAKADRGEAFLQKTLDEVRQATADQDDVALRRLRTDIYKYVAKISNPKEFTETQKIDAKVGVASYVIDTGIRREGDPGYNVDETAMLNEGGKEGSDVK